MLFQDRHIEMIREGTKTATRRDWKDGYPGVNPGVHMAQTSLFESEEECDCFIVITNRYEEPLREMDEDDAEKEGGYDLATFREKWREINGEDSWNPEQVVDVVEFVYGGRSRKEAEQRAQELGVA